MASMETSVGKTYDEIWKNFVSAHLSPQMQLQDLKRIHDKWVKIAAECK